jgi:hypothetical protein
VEHLTAEQFQERLAESERLRGEAEKMRIKTAEIDQKATDIVTGLIVDLPVRFNGSKPITLACEVRKDHYSHYDSGRGNFNVRPRSPVYFDVVSNAGKVSRVTWNTFKGFDQNTMPLDMEIASSGGRGRELPKMICIDGDWQKLDMGGVKRPKPKA